MLQKDICVGNFLMVFDVVSVLLALCFVSMNIRSKYYGFNNVSWSKHNQKIPTNVNRCSTIKRNWELPAKQYCHMGKVVIHWGSVNMLSWNISPTSQENKCDGVLFTVLSFNFRPNCVSFFKEAFSLDLFYCTCNVSCECLLLRNVNYVSATIDQL